MERSSKAPLISRRGPRLWRRANLWQSRPAQVWAPAAVQLPVPAHQVTAPALTSRVPFWIVNKVELKERELLRQQFNAMVPWGRRLSAQGGRGCKICATDQTHVHRAGRIHA